MSGTKDIVAAGVKAETDDSLSEIDNVNIDKVNPLMPPAILMESLPISAKGRKPTSPCLRLLTLDFTHLMPYVFCSIKDGIGDSPAIHGNHERCVIFLSTFLLFAAPGQP
jgi:hypothetical protein